MIIYGLRASKIGQAPMMDTTCPVCDEKDSFILSTFGRYFHILWIPLFPAGRKYTAECSNCDTTFKKKEADKFVNNGWEYSKPFDKAKRPFWHSLGSLLVLGLIVLSTVGGALGYAVFGDDIDAHKNDPRYVRLQADLDILNDSPYNPTDTLGALIKSCIDSHLELPINKDRIRYLTKRTGGRVLVLMSVRDMKPIDRSERRWVVDRLAYCLEKRQVSGMDSLYVGVQGKWNMLLTKSPSESELGGTFASDDPLLPFYNDLLARPAADSTAVMNN